MTGRGKRGGAGREGELENFSRWLWGRGEGEKDIGGALVVTLVMRGFGERGREKGSWGGEDTR